MPPRPRNAVPSNPRYSITGSRGAHEVKTFFSSKLSRQQLWRRSILQFHLEGSLFYTLDTMLAYSIPRLASLEHSKGLERCWRSRTDNSYSSKELPVLTARIFHQKRNGLSLLRGMVSILCAIVIHLIIKKFNLIFQALAGPLWVQTWKFMHARAERITTKKKLFHILTDWQCFKMFKITRFINVT